METLRRILSVPMLLTALALAWVLGRQAGVDGMTVGARRRAGGRRSGCGRPGGGSGAGCGLGWRAGAAGADRWRGARAGAHARGRRRRDAGGAEPFSEARLAALRAEGRPVFAYFTADWCLTCKVNEKAAIERRGAGCVKAQNVAVLVGDWTDGDPVLGRFIEAHNRAGVPLYLYYAPGAGAPQVLPQVLTPGMLAATRPP